MVTKVIEYKVTFNVNDQAIVRGQQALGKLDAEAKKALTSIGQEMKKAGASTEVINKHLTTLVQTMQKTNAASKDWASGIKAVHSAMGPLNTVIDSTTKSVNAHTAATNQAKNAQAGWAGQARQTQTALGALSRGIATTATHIPLMAGGWVAAGIALTKFVSDAVGKFVELEDEIYNIKSIKPEINVTGLMDDLQELSSEIPATATELAGAYYNIASSIQLTADETLRLLELTAQGAIAARTSQETWAAAVVGTMNAMHMSVEDVSHIMDVMFLTVKNGVVTGEQLAADWGKLVKQGSLLGLTLEEIGAAVTVVTTQGGNASESMNDLTNVFQKLTNREPLEALKKLGVDAYDTYGNLLPLADILNTLNFVLNDMTEAEKGAALDAIAPDAQQQRGLIALLNGVEKYSEQLRANTTAVDEWGKAQDIQMDAAAKKLQLAQNQWDSFLAGVGGGIASIGPSLVEFWNNLTGQGEGQVAGEIGAYFGEYAKALGDLGDAVDEFLGTDLFNVNSDLHMTVETGAAIAALKEAQSQAEDTSGTLIDAMAEADAENKASWDSISQDVESANNVYQSLLNETSIAVKEYEDAVHEMATGSIDDFEKNAEAADKWAAEIEARSLRAQEAASAAAEAWRKALVLISSYMGQLPDADVVSSPSEKRGARQSIYDKGGIPLTTPPTTFTEEQLAADIERKKLQAARDKQVRDAEIAAGLREPPKEKKSKEDMIAEAAEQLRQQQNLAIIEGELTDIQKELNAETARYKDELAGLNKELSDLEANEKKALQPLKDDAYTKRNAADSQREIASEEMERLDDTIYDVGQQLADLEARGDAALDPLIFAAKLADHAVASLRRQIEMANRQFAERQHDISMDQRGLNNRERASMDPLNARATAHQRELARMARETELAMRPLDDALYAENQHLTDLQDSYEELANELDSVLNPLLLEQARLTRELQNLDQLKNLNDQKVGVENLAGQLANLVPGSADYLHVQQQMIDAQNRLNISQRQFDLGNRIDQLEEEKRVALESKKLEIKAQQDLIASMEKQREALRRDAELRARVVADNLALIEAERQAKQDEFDREQAILDSRQRMLDEEREDYAYRQGQEMQKRQDNADTANAAVTNQQEINRVREEAKRAELAGLTEIRAARQRELEAQQDDLDDAARLAEAALTNMGTLYNTLKGQITEAMDTAKTKHGEIVEPLNQAAIKVGDLKDKLADAYKAMDLFNGAIDKGVGLTNSQWKEFDEAKRAAGEVETQLGTMKTKGIDPLSLSMDKATPGTFAALWHKEWDPEVTGGIAKTHNTTLHDMSIKTDEWVLAEKTQVSKATEEWNALTEAINKAKGAAGDPTHQTPPIPPIGPPPPPGLAMGGHLGAGQPAWVGEEGMELFVPHSSGQIISRRSLASYLGSYVGGSQGGVVNVALSFPGVKSVPTSPQGWRPYARDLGVALQREGILGGRIPMGGTGN